MRGRRITAIGFLSFFLVTLLTFTGAAIVHTSGGAAGWLVELALWTGVVSSALALALGIFLYRRGMRSERRRAERDQLLHTVRDRVLEQAGPRAGPPDNN